MPAFASINFFQWKGLIAAHYNGWKKLLAKLLANLCVTQVTKQQEVQGEADRMASHTTLQLKTTCTQYQDVQGGADRTATHTMSLPKPSCYETVGLLFIFFFCIVIILVKHYKNTIFYYLKRFRLETTNEQENAVDKQNILISHFL